MKIKLAKWGNSLAVRIPAPIAERVGLTVGTLMEIEDSGDGLRLVPIEKTPSIEELAQLITEENKHSETDWGDSIGLEV